MSILSNGTLLQGGKYRIIKMLGQGGFGITYLGEQTGLGRKVAVKEFFMEKLCNRDEETSQVSVGSEGSREMVNRFREKFLKEARSIANLHHRHIVSVIDIFEENGTAYYVMEYCNGGSLSVMMRQQYPDGMPEERALKYIRQIASALDYVHKRRINHLDVKPGNIMLNEDDDAILIDFGLAKQYDSTTGQQTSSTPVGVSEGYAPMEQYKLGGVGTFSPPTDIYSLGATLYKLVTGQTPPSALDIDEVNLSDFPLSPSVKRAIRAAMGHRRTDRPQSISEFLSLLTEVNNNNNNDDERTAFLGPAQKSVKPSDSDEEKTVFDQPRESKTQPRVRVTQPQDSNEDVLAAFFGSKPKARTQPSAPSPSRVRKPAAQPAAQHAEKTKASSQPTKSGRSNKLLIWGLLLAVVVVAGVFVLLQSGSSYPTKPDPTVDGVKAGHEYVDLGLSVLWSTSNLGTEITNADGIYESAYQQGLHYAWGVPLAMDDPKRKDPNLCQEYAEDKSHLGKPLDEEHDPVCQSWGGGWRTPTKDEIFELMTRCNYEQNYSEFDYANRGLYLTGPNGHILYLPYGGFLYWTDIYDEDQARYWASDVSPKHNNQSYFLNLSYEGPKISVTQEGSYEGFSIRPVIDR